MPEEGESGAAARDEGVAPLLTELRAFAADARHYAESEMALQRARVRVIGRGVRQLALFGILAVIFVVFAVGGLTVGLLLALTPLVTAWGATAIVVGLWVLIVLLCVRRVMGAWKRMVRAITGPTDSPR